MNRNVTCYHQQHNKTWSCHTEIYAALCVPSSLARHALNNKCYDTKQDMCGVCTGRHVEGVSGRDLKAEG